MTYWIAGATEPLPADCAGGVVPITYLICENDNAIPVFIQEKFAKNLGEGCEIVRCDAGHCPFLSQADKVVELVVGLAEEYGAKEKE